ncbi:MAG TPA: hypothetical protein VGR81_07295 [Candidatus Acidoferrales bacterium]|nr:hypothetical protein [Candidatus Acidoferrales bacterium]
MGARAVIAVFVLGFTFVAAAQSARVQKEIARHQAEYASETDPVRKAKIVVKLGRAENKAAQQSADIENFVEALDFMKDYEQKASETDRMLDKTGVNPESHSNGFRQLQISVRENLRTVRQIANRAPFDQRQPFLDLAKHLDALNQKLLAELFPRRPREANEEKQQSR